MHPDFKYHVAFRKGGKGGYTDTIHPDLELKFLDGGFFGKSILLSIHIQFNVFEIEKTVQGGLEAMLLKQLENYGTPKSEYRTAIASYREALQDFSGILWTQFLVWEDSKYMVVVQYDHDTELPHLHKEIILKENNNSSIIFKEMQAAIQKDKKEEKENNPEKKQLGDSVF